MRGFNEIEGVEDFLRRYMDYQTKFVAEGSTFAGDWTRYVSQFLKLNLPNSRFATKTKIATIGSGISFAEIERFVQSIENFIVDDIIYDPVSNSFTFYGRQK